MNSPAAPSAPRASFIWNPLRLEDGIPTWRYAVADALLELQIFMAPEANTSYLRIELLRATRHCASRSSPMSRIATITAKDAARSPSNWSRRPAVPHSGLPRRPPLSPLDHPRSSSRRRRLVLEFLASRGSGARTRRAEDLLSPGHLQRGLDARQPMFFIATAETAPQREAMSQVV